MSTTPTTDPTTSVPCRDCDAPLADDQRYCVVCGTSRHHPNDPAMRYLAESRAAERGAATTVGDERVGSGGRWAAVAFALLPLAAGLGVVLARSGRDSDSDIAAALRAQKPQIVQVGGTGATGATGIASAGTTASAVGALGRTDFKLTKGYTVELQALSSAAAVAGAEKQAAKRGARDVGVLDASAFRVSPAASGRFVIFAGQFHARGGATTELRKLKKRFPKAGVIRVQSAAAAAAAASTQVTSKKVAPPPTAKQKAAGAKVVKQIQAAKGKSYVDQQRKLPDTIVVP